MLAYASLTEASAVLPAGLLAADSRQAGEVYCEPHRLTAPNTDERNGESNGGGGKDGASHHPAPALSPNQSGWPLFFLCQGDGNSLSLDMCARARVNVQCVCACITCSLRQVAPVPHTQSRTHTNILTPSSHNYIPPSPPLSHIVLTLTSALFLERRKSFT